MNKCYIMRGLQGSGKSTLAKAIADSNPNSFIFSTDNYFIRPDGFYDFNFRRLHEAHAWNFQNFCEAVDLQLPYVIVDNVNAGLWEFEKYVEYAHKNGYEIYIMEPKTPWANDPNECFKRNTHGVPLDSLIKKWEKFEATASVVKALNRKGIEVKC